MKIGAKIRKAIINAVQPRSNDGFTFIPVYDDAGMHLYTELLIDECACLDHDVIPLFVQHLKGFLISDKPLIVVSGAQREALRFDRLDPDTYSDRYTHEDSSCVLSDHLSARDCYQVDRRE